MVVTAPGHQAESLLGQPLDQHSAVLHDTSGIVGELGGGSLAEGHRLGRDHMLQRTTLETGEQGLVDGRGQILGTQDGPASGTAQRLVGGKGDDVGMGYRVGMDATGDQSGNVGRVEHEQGAHFVGNGAERRRVDDAGIGGGTGHDELGPVLEGEVPDLVVVDALIAGGHAVGHEPVGTPADVHRRAVSEVTAVVQAHTQHGVTRFQHGQVGGHVGVGPRVRLHVGVVGPKQGGGPLPCDGLHLVDHHVAAVVAATGIPLAVLVGEHRSSSRKNRGRSEVLRGDELHGGVLALDLSVDHFEHRVVAVDGPHQGATSSLGNSASILATRGMWRPSSKTPPRRSPEHLWPARGQLAARPDRSRWRRCAPG